MELDAAIKLRHNYSNLKKEAAFTSETSVFIYKTTRHYSQQNRTLNTAKHFNQCSWSLDSLSLEHHFRVADTGIRFCLGEYIKQHIFILILEWDGFINFTNTCQCLKAENRLNRREKSHHNLQQRHYALLYILPRNTKEMVGKFCS